MQNKIIQSLWIGEILSPIEYICINSFLKNGHEFHLYTYNESMKNVPVGTVIKDAREIIPSEYVYKDVADLYTSFANWFRYKLLYVRGGWWVDMDVICLKQFDFPGEYCFTTEMTFNNKVPKIIVNNAIIKSPPKAELFEIMLKAMEASDLVKAPWGTFGSRFLNKGLEAYDSEEFIQPMYVFCPLNWHEINLLFAESIELTFDHCHAIHLWNNMWAEGGYKKNHSYSSTSLIEKLKSQYL